jgi:hypothetical protein
LLDTDVLSHLVKREPDKYVLRCCLDPNDDLNSPGGWSG